MKPILLLAFANERQNNVRYLRALSDERRAIKAALDPAIRAGLCELVELPNATLPEIFAAFQDGRHRDRIALFHYGGHAGSDALLLEKNDGENATAHSAGLIPFLTTQKGLEMVFLNGCNTEQWARALNEAGIPLVAGTFEAIRDQVAQQLATQFYTGLGQGLPLRRAWDEAIARSRTESGDDLRSIGREGFLLDRFPWDLFQRKGADQANYWNLPDATGDPLAALPLPESHHQLPLPNEPFRFLDRYRKTDTPIFFGRGHDIRDLYDRLTNPVGSPVVLLSGQSGVGKSSLLEAGLLPRLEDRYTALYLRRDAETGLDETLKQALSAACGAQGDLRACWNTIEQQSGKPLICIVDQAEEAFTRERGKGAQEIEIFAHTLLALFGNVVTRPKGKLLVGFRKEYEAEIEDVLKQQKIDYESVFLKRLTRAGIVEVVNGLTSAPRLVQKYGLRIETGLPDLIAADLLADSDTPVSPVLQIILTKLWKGLPRDEDRLFTQKEYLRLKEDGIFLGDFFRQQMEKLREWERQTGKDVESSGMALDVLNSHATDLGFANSRDMDELKIAYQHRADVLEDLVKQFKELYLLTDAGATRNALAHDTLAPVVLQEVKNSDRPGQKALRILTGKTANYRRNPDKTVIDEDDLALVEQGQSGMRMWVAEEPELINKSRERRAKLRRQRRLAWVVLLVLGGLAIWFGNGNYQKNLIDGWVSQARLENGQDPTMALQTLQNALGKVPDNLAILAAYNDVWSNNEFYEYALLHPDAVKGVIMAPDTSNIFYSWTENTIYCWLSDGQKKDTFSTKNISAVALSPNGRSLVVSTQDGSITEIETPELNPKDEGRPFGKEHATCLTFSADGNTLIAATKDSIIHLLRVGSMKNAQSKFKVSNEISCLSFHPYKNTLLIGYIDGKIEERTLNGQIIANLNSHGDTVLSFAISPLDSNIVSAGRDGRILFHSNKNKNTVILKGDEGRINDIKWSPDGTRLFSSNDGYLIKKWSQEGDLISVYRGHTGFVNGISLSKDGQYFASAGEDKTVHIWKTEAKLFQRYGPHVGGVSGIVLSKDGTTITTSSDNGGNDISERINDPNFGFDELISLLFGISPRSIFTWNVSSGAKKSEWKGHKGGINALVDNQDGTIMVSASDDSTAIIWKPTGVPDKILARGHQGRVLAVAVAPNGQQMVTVGDDSLVIIWNRSGGIIKIIKQNDLVRTVDFSPDGQWFAIGCYDGRVHIIDLNGHTKKTIRIKKDYRVECIAISPNAQYIAIGTWGTDVETVNFEKIYKNAGKRVVNSMGKSISAAYLYSINGSLVSSFNGLISHNKTGGAAIKSIAFSSNGKNIGLGDEGGLVQVFRLVNEQPVLMQKLQHYPKRAILSLAFTPDGKGLLTGSADGWARWWQIKK